MIVASKAGEERRENMESVLPATCRDCGTALATDSYSRRLSENHPLRAGRPVLYFCTDCCLKYDRKSIQDFQDHRDRERFPR